MSAKAKLLTSRKVFFINRPKNGTLVKSPTTAAGILFFKVIDGKIYLLLISYNEKKYSLLDDLGGRAEVYDQSIFQTINREVAEESNDLIQVDSQNLQCNQVYVADSKYLCLIVKLDSDAYQDTSIFGTFESTNKFERTIKWYEFTDQLKPQLSHRIRQSDIYDAIAQSI